MARGANNPGPAAMPVHPTVSTRKKVPKSSLAGLFMIHPLREIFPNARVCNRFTLRRVHEPAEYWPVSAKKDTPGHISATCRTSDPRPVVGWLATTLPSHIANRRTPLAVQELTDGRTKPSKVA